MNTNKKAKRSLVLSAVVAVVLAGILGFVANGSGGSGNVAYADVTPEELNERLTVTKSDLVSDESKCASDAFLDNSRKQVRLGDVAYRQFTDAVSIPYGTEVPDEILALNRVERCGNPTFLDMEIRGLMNKVVFGETLGERNPWMAEFVELSADGLYVWLEKDAEGNFYVSTEYQRYAQWLNELIRWVDFSQGVGSWTSQEHWHLVPVSQGLPRVKLAKKPESLPAFRGELTAKGVGCVLAFGWNMADKRLEIFECAETPTPPVSSTTLPEPTTTPPSSSTPGTTNPPEEPTTTPPSSSTPGTTNPPEEPTTTVPSTTPTTVPTTRPTTTQPATTTTNPPEEPTTTTTIPRTCGNKNKWVDKNGNGKVDEGECVPRLNGGSTVPPPPATPPPATPTTAQPAPPPPPTAALDSTPSNVIVVNPTPPPNTYTPPGAVVGTTQPATTVAPPATNPAAEPGNGGGTTPSR